MTYKIIISFVLALCLSNLFTKVVVEDTYESKLILFEKRQVFRDSIIFQDSIAIRKLQIERDSLILVQNTIDNELDSAINIIKSHTKITVTENDVIEALSWIKETHGIKDTIK